MKISLKYLLEPWRLNWFWSKIINQWFAIIKYIIPILLNNLLFCIYFSLVHLNRNMISFINGGHGKLTVLTYCTLNQ